MRRECRVENEALGLKGDCHTLATTRDEYSNDTLRKVPSINKQRSIWHTIQYSTALSTVLTPFTVRYMITNLITSHSFTKLYVHKIIHKSVAKQKPNYKSDSHLSNLTTYYGIN